MKLIDKDALVAEIERRLNHQVYLSVEREIRKQLLNGLLLFINTLEVKEDVECDIEGTVGEDGLARIKGDYKYGDKVKLIIIKED